MHGTSLNKTIGYVTPKKKTAFDMRNECVIRIPLEDATEFVFLKSMIMFIRGESFLNKVTEIRQASYDPYVWALSPRDLIAFGRMSAKEILKDKFNIKQVTSAAKRIMKIGEELFHKKTITEICETSGANGVKRVLCYALVDFLIENIGEENVSVGEIKECEVKPL